MAFAQKASSMIRSIEPEAPVNDIQTMTIASPAPSASHDSKPRSSRSSPRRRCSSPPSESSAWSRIQPRGELRKSASAWHWVRIAQELCATWLAMGCVRS